MEISEFNVMREEQNYKYYVNGEWRTSSSGNVVAVRSPYNNELIANTQACTKEEVNQIIQIARESIGCWLDTPLQERAQVLRKAAELMTKWSEPLGEILMKEIGKPIKSAISEIIRTAEIFNATAEASSQLSGETIMGDAFEGFLHVGWG